MSKNHRMPAKIAVLAAAIFMIAPAVAGPLPPTPTPPSSVSATTPFAAAATLYAEDFEIHDGGYSSSDATVWQHGTPVSPPSLQPGQGVNAWGTVLAGDYTHNTCASLTSAEIDLSGTPQGISVSPGSVARLAFRQWFQLESRWDGGVVQTSSDGVNWVLATPFGGYNNTFSAAAVRTCLGLDATGQGYTSATGSPLPPADRWWTGEFDVTSYLGGSLYVRWIFATDGSVAKRGWYLDDVIVQVGAGASATVPLPAPPSTSTPTSAFVAAANVAAEDFEAGDGGWVGTAPWEYGAPTSPPNTVPGSLNLWGTRLASNYLPNECGTLTSPELSLPGAGVDAQADAARVVFKMWRHMERNYDAVLLQVSTDDGTTWERVPAPSYDGVLTSSLAASVRACLGVSTAETVWTGPSSPTPSPDAWSEYAADLTPWMGKTLRLRFVFGSEASGEYRGVYVDDVVVQIGAGATLPAVDPDGPLPSTVAPGWTLNGTGSWQYGVPSSGPASTDPTWATNLAGAYAPGECQAIESPEIQTSAIPGLGRLTLYYDHYFRGSGEGGVVQVSTNGGATWTTVNPNGGYGGTLGTTARACLAPGATTAPGYVSNPTGSAYARAEVNLNSFAGQAIKIRFFFASDTSTQYEGWYIRDITLSKGAGSVPLANLEAPIAEALFAKADAGLAGALKAGVREEVPVIVTGPAITGIREHDFATRADAIAAIDAQAESFLATIRHVVAVGGGEVAAEWSIGPSVKVIADLPLLEALAKRSDVESIVIDHEGTIRLIDPIEDDSVGVENTQGRQMIQAEDIWALGFRGEGIKIAVIDTGIVLHEAFRYANGSSRVSAWVDYVNSNPVPYDDYGHGTHVAGTALGSSHYVDPVYGAFQETGVAPEATLLVAKFLNSGGSGTTTGAINSINWAFSNGADITSNSWGASGCGSSFYPVMAAVRTTTDAGMLNVFAAGNSGSGSGTIGSPACSESALSVGAVDNNKVIAAFSSRGPCSDNEIGGPSRICPDVVAKGVAVRSAIPRSGSANQDPTGYKVWQGTSMATPHVAGAAALAEQMKRFYTGIGWDTPARAEEQVFKMTSLDLGAAGEDNTYGWGLPQLLNIYALLDSSDEANIVSTFGISRATVRQGESTLLTFSVRNLGGAQASGTFTATLYDPLGTPTVLRSSNPTLGLLDGESFAHTFTVTGNGVAPGEYTFEGSFEYMWTDPTTGDPVFDSVFHSGTFSVRRVFVDVTISGYGDAAMPGEMQTVTWTATNVGNDAATNVVVEFTVSDRYQFVPGSNFDPANPLTRYANPAPTSVKEDKNFGRVTLVFAAPNLDEGDSFSFTTSLLPTVPGHYRALSVIKFKDGSGASFGQGYVNEQDVGVPLP